MYSPIPAQSLPLTSNSTFVPFSQDTNKKSNPDQEKTGDSEEDNVKQSTSNSETADEDTESKEKLLKDNDSGKDSQRDKEGGDSTELIPKVQLPPFQVNSIQISVYPWHCLVPQLFNVPANSLTQQKPCNVVTSQEGQKNADREQNRRESASDSANHGNGEERRPETRVPGNSGPNTRKRTRSSSFTSQDEGKPAVKVQVGIS